eukprot:COSAG01_NODE_51245_length_356_cov_0.968872_1_plen_78_part_10
MDALLCSDAVVDALVVGSGRAAQRHPSSQHLRSWHPLEGVEARLVAAPHPALHPHSLLARPVLPEQHRQQGPTLLQLV